MNKILNSSSHVKYTSNELIGKYIYFSKKHKDSVLYYIFNIKEIDKSEGNSKIKYICPKVYLLMVPDDKDRKVFLYDNYKDVIVNATNDILYEMSFSEYVNTFRSFVDLDGKYVYEMPSKIIQDI